MPNTTVEKMYCGALKRGDVVLAEEKGKEKLFVVLQDDVLNQGLPTVVCATIEPCSSGDEVMINEVMLKKYETGLGQEGICMLHKIFTIDRRSIFAKKSEITDERMLEIHRAMDINFGRFRDKVK